MAIEKKAHATWEGGLKDGRGQISTESGTLADAPYGFNTRFEGKRGTNPEELIAAAHSGCFSMALSMMLEKEGFKPAKLDCDAVVTLEQQGEGFAVTRSALTLRADVPGIDGAKFEEIAGKAKAGCPISKLLNAEITLDATLSG